MTSAPSICRNVIFLGKKLLNVERKLLYLGIFGQEPKKPLYCGILHQHPQIFPNTKFRPKIKIHKFGAKISLIGYFGPEFQKANAVF